jgi:glutathione-regulated potassium-efflux system ancillary protein KefC
MTGVWAFAALWFGLALIASLLSIWFHISTALSEIIVGMIAQFFFAATIGADVLGVTEPWVKFLAGVGAIILTFMAGAELDPQVFKLKWKEAAAIGFASFLFPFLGCAAAAHYFLGWEVMPSLLAGLALAATSVAVVYTVMMEFGFNRTDFGKTILAGCFITDLGTVVGLGLIFAPFTIKTLVFVGAGVAVFLSLPWLTPRLSNFSEASLPSLKRNFCFSACSEWVHSPHGLIVRQSSQLTSSVWCLLERSEGIMLLSGACVP